MDFGVIFDSILGKIAILDNGTHVVQLDFINHNNYKLFSNKTKSNISIEAMKQIEDYLNKKRINFDIPLNPSGTTFQLKVWKELQNIPYGETKSYKEIATKIGKPNAQRAIGGANNKNPIPIIIPCHRVISHNGGLNGYAYGIDIKRKLLELEGLKFIQN